MLKKTEVVMLPTNQKAIRGSLILNEKGTCLYIAAQKDADIVNSNHFHSNSNPQHLYFLSDEEVKENDWFIMNGCILRQCKQINNNLIASIEDTTGGQHYKDVCEKVIASTDESINIEKDVLSINQGRFWNHYPTEKRILPQPSKSFLEVFVREYNKGNIIRWVNVEHEDEIITESTTHDGNPASKFVGIENRLKINPKDNTITIKPIKDSFTFNLNQLETVLSSFAAYTLVNANEDSRLSTKDWIEKNL